MQSTTWVKKESELVQAKAALLAKSDDPLSKMLPPWLKDGKFMQKIKENDSFQRASEKCTFFSSFKLRPFKGL